MAFERWTFVFSAHQQKPNTGLFYLMLAGDVRQIFLKCRVRSGEFQGSPCCVKEAPSTTLGPKGMMEGAGVEGGRCLGCRGRLSDGREPVDVAPWIRFRPHVGMSGCVYSEEGRASCLHVC